MRRTPAYLRGLPLPRIGVPAAWMVVLAAIPFLTGFYLLLPAEGLARTIAYPAYGVIAVAAIMVGIHRRRPRSPGSWRLIALAFALMSIGDVTYTLLDVAGDVPYPSWADLTYLAGYVSLIGGVLGLVRGRATGGDRTPVIDAAILAVGAASVVWIAIIQPSLVGAVDPVVVATSLAYPAGFDRDRSDARRGYRDVPVKVARKEPGRAL